MGRVISRCNVPALVVLREMKTTSSTPMKLPARLLPLLFPAAAAFAQLVPDTLQNTLVPPPGLLAGARQGTAVAIDGTTVVTVAPDDRDPADGSSAAALRVYHAGTGALLHTLMIDDFYDYDFVAVSGTRVAVADSWNDDVLVFDLASATPTVPVVTITVNFSFSAAVALSGTTLAVGNERDEIVFIYDLASATPSVPVHTLTDPTGVSFSDFGRAVDLSGTQLVVGAPGAQKAIVYDLASATPTTPTHTLTMPAPSSLSDLFGESVGFVGTKIVVGSPRYTGVGQAFYYDLASATPTTPLLICPSPDGESSFGSAVAITAAAFFVGAPSAAGGGTERGRVYAFNFTSNAPAFTYQNPTPADGDRFGTAFAAAGTRLVIGAPGDDTAAFDAGAAYSYLGTSPTPGVPIATLNATSPEMASLLGADLFFSNTHLVAFAAGKVTSAGGGEAVCYVRSGASFIRLGAVPGIPLALDGARLVMGDPTYTGVKIYDLASATPWVPVHTIAPPAEVAMSDFGFSAALSGDRVAVGCAQPPSTGPYHRVYVYDLAGATPTTPVLALRTPDEFQNFDSLRYHWAVVTAPFGFALAMEGSRLAVGEPGIYSPSVPGRFHIFDLDSATPERALFTITAPVGVTGTFGDRAVISGGRLLLTSIYNGIAHLYDLDGASPAVPALTFTPPGGPSYVYDGAIAGRRLALASTAGTHVYDLLSSTPLTPIATVPLASGAVALANGWLAVGSTDDDTAGANQGAALIFGPAVATPELLLEVDGRLVAPGQVLDFGAVSPGLPTAESVKLLNTGTAPLAIAAFNFSGPAAARFSITPASAGIIVGAATNATITIAPGASGALSATVNVNDNAPEAVTFGLAANALSYATDTDSDGLSDGTEIDLAAFGFDWQLAQPALTAAYNAAANHAGYYTQSQLQALKPSAPLIAKNPATGQFTLTLGIQRSVNLQTFTPFPMVPAGTTLNGQGQIEYRFTTGDNAAFFRVEGQ
jgi:hypothetical protein